MSTTAAAPSSGGNIISNTLGSLFGGDSTYNYQGTFRERFGESLTTDTQKEIRRARDAQAVLADLMLAQNHSKALRKNINRSIAATGGQPLDPTVVPSVETQATPKSNLHLAAGIPVRV